MHSFALSARRIAAATLRQLGRPPAAPVVLATLVIVSILQAASALGTVTVTPLAIEGAASPDGNGAFGAYIRFNEPCVNDSGQVAFVCRLEGSAGGSLEDEVLGRAEPNGALTLIAREGSAIPGGTGFYGNLNAPPRCYTMNNAGRVAFVVNLTGTPGGTSDNQALFSSDGIGAAIHARRGDPAPGTATTLNGIFAPGSINNESPAGIAFYASLAPSTGRGALYVAGGTTLTLVPTLGQPAPDANGTIMQFGGSDPPAIRPNSRQVALWLHMFGTVLGSRDDDGIFVAAPGTITQVARGHETIEGAEYHEFTEPVYNVLGNAAYLTHLYPTSDGDAIVVAGDGSDDLVARRGRALPGGTGFFDNFDLPALSAGNVAAFGAGLTGTPGGGLDDSGIYRGDGTILIEAARADQAVPEGGGRFDMFGNLVGINAAAQVLFTATLRGTPGGTADDRGLYLWDEVNGLVKLLREGDVIGGRTVLAFSTLTARDFGGFRCLNDAGVAVARVDLSGIGGDGIYLFQNDPLVAVEPHGGAPRADLVAGPCPFGAAPLTMHYEIPAAGHVRITAFDIGGRAVRTLLDDPADRNGTLRWNGDDANGRPLPSGVYFVRLESPDATVVRRVVRAR